VTIDKTEKHTNKLLIKIIQYVVKWFSKKRSATNVLLKYHNNCCYYLDSLYLVPVTSIDTHTQTDFCLVFFTCASLQQCQWPPGWLLFSSPPPLLIITMIWLFVGCNNCNWHHQATLVDCHCRNFWHLESEIDTGVDALVLALQRQH